jgi:hypothetical protein
MHSLTSIIADLRRRLVWHRRATAACRTLAVVVAAAAVLGAADYLIRFNDRGLRLMMTGALTAVAAWAIHRWWIQPRRHRLAPLSVTRRIESKFPQLRDRLASAIEFLGQSEDDPTAGSAALRRAVVADAELAVGDLPLETIIDRRPLRQAAIWAALAAAAVVLALIVDAGAVRTAAARLVAPFGATDWPRTNHLEFRDPPARLAIGRAFDVELVDRSGMLPDDVRIDFRITRDGRREVESAWMTRVGEVMVARRDGLRSSFSFRAEGGDDHSMRWLEVEVIEPPQLDSLTIVAHPPAYTGLPAAEAERNIDVLIGTGIEVSGTANEPLSSARILAGDQSIAASIQVDAAGRERRAFTIPPREWIATESGKYQLELESTHGVAGMVAEESLDVEPDTAPDVTWLRPRDDLFVLESATIPLEVKARDNLAIERIELQYTRTDQSHDVPASIELYRGPEVVSAATVLASADRGETRTVDTSWPLEPLRLAVGTQLTLHATAGDYRPGTGVTPLPRRITIITRAEFDARLADRLEQLLRRLDEIVSLQRSTRESVRYVEIQLRDAGQLTDGDAGSLAAAELNQRQVGRDLADPIEGLPAMADELIDTLQINGVSDAAIEIRIEELRRSIDQLSADPLPAIERELTAARKAAQSFRNRGDVAPIQELVQTSLSAAGGNQDQVIIELERLRDLLSDSADLGRIVRDLAQLHADQLAHREATRQAIGLETLPLEWRELSRQQQARLNQAAAAQGALAERYERIERGMETLAQAADTVNRESHVRAADALALARQLGIAGQMRGVSLELADNRVGQALAREQQIADALLEVLNTLRAREESRADRLVEGLRAAERDLASLRGKLAELRERLDQADAPAAAAAESDRQQQLRSQIERLSRQLDRLQAAAAGQSASRAAERLTDRAADGSKLPAAARREQVEQAEQDLAEAAAELAQRRREEEENLAREFLQRVQKALAAMVGDQRGVVQSTAELDAGRQSAQQLTDDERRTAADLAEKERTLAEEAHAQGEMISGLHVFVLALGRAADELAAAATRLDRGETGAATQQIEQQALARLEEIVAALSETSAELEAEPQQPGGAANAGGQPGENPPRLPAFDLFEVKLLRSLQADLNRRTKKLQQSGEQTVTTPDVGQTGRESQAAELAAEQRRLAELVSELLSRDNGGGDDQ